MACVNAIGCRTGEETCRACVEAGNRRQIDRASRGLGLAGGHWAALEAAGLSPSCAAVTELCEQRADCCELGGGVHQPLSNRQRTLAHGALGPRVKQRLSLACRPLQERRVQLAHVLGGDVENAARVRGRPPQIIQQRERDLRPSAAGALCTRIGRIERKRLDRVTSEFDVDHETLQRISLRTRDPEASSTSEGPGRGIRRRHHRLARIVGARLTETTREHARTSADGEGSLALQFALSERRPARSRPVPAPDVHPLYALRVGIRECVRQPIEGEISGRRLTPRLRGGV